MKSEKGFLVIGVRDTRGNAEIELAIHDYDKVEFSFPANEDHRGVAFFGCVYDLPEWCMNHGFQCRITPRTIEVEFPEFPDVTTE